MHFNPVSCFRGQGSKGGPDSEETFPSILHQNPNLANKKEYGSGQIRVHYNAWRMIPFLTLVDRGAKEDLIMKKKSVNLPKSECDH